MFAAIRPKGSLLPATDPGLCRVSIQSGTAVADLALPAGIPVTVLTPSIVDILKPGEDGDGLTAKRYRLSLPGSAALDPSKTLAQSGIPDGAVLLLSRAAAPPPAGRHHDVAEAVSETLAVDSAPGPGRRPVTRLAGAISAICVIVTGALAMVRNTSGANGNHEGRAAAGVLTVAVVVALLSAAVAHRAYRDAVAGVTLSAIATAFAAVAGFLAVPGAPGVWHVVLASTAAAATCVLATRSSGCGAVTLTALSSVATVVAGAALVGAITAAPPQAIGAAAALVSLGLLGTAARASIVLAGLSPRLATSSDTDETEAAVAGRTLRADAWLSSLLAGLSSSAALGAVVTVLAGAPRLSCIAFGGITGTLLLLRARSADNRRMLAFAITGIGVVGTTFGVAAFRATGHGPWVAAATATLTAAAIYLGFAAPTLSLPLIARRSVEALEWLALIAVVPLTFWICGLYGAARGMAFT
ncbi:type VII secretion integral membrane protein EccD [Mycobacterium paraseoulense]|uniref:Type VII secretion integral membrane protein EccD n=1 Tax=Mycobacterium paraseoulense TaxID=590652 RepID=A0A1X0I3T7_9MYCO|nr:type VII secretion integral membrane protein EccD [Mycobacterium paraseoulense]MCV7394719.1 type VII secretion integral membrane protein EccD [Mycobacterium paraseoulense]ORB33743.1 type VII secretion integral membrane protein EccD [Mycobacterium paraseoulense]